MARKTSTEFSTRLRRQRSPVLFDKRFDNRQPYAQLGRPSRRGAMYQVQHMQMVIPKSPGPVVCDLQLIALVRPAERHTVIHASPFSAAPCLKAFVTRLSMMCLNRAGNQST